MTAKLLQTPERLGRFSKLVGTIRSFAICDCRECPARSFCTTYQSGFRNPKLSLFAQTREDSQMLSPEEVLLLSKSL